MRVGPVLRRGCVTDEDGSEKQENDYLSYGIRTF